LFTSPGGRGRPEKKGVKSLSAEVQNRTEDGGKKGDLKRGKSVGVPVLEEKAKAAGAALRKIEKKEVPQKNSEKALLTEGKILRMRKGGRKKYVLEGNAPTSPHRGAFLKGLEKEKSSISHKTFQKKGRKGFLLLTSRGKGSAPGTKRRREGKRCYC